MLYIAGAGMAGLCAAARARELGLDVAVFEKGNRPGGSMLLSSCVVWRYLDADAFHEESPPDGAEPLLLATGGFQGDRELVREHVAPAGELMLRANRWSSGDGMRIAVDRGAALSAGMGEFYGRAMPAPPAAIPEDRFVDLAQLYGRYALVLDDGGREFAPEQISWSETDLVQAIARRPNAQAWYVVDADGSVVEGLYAAGADAGGIAAGGYASGLASALVFGRLAAETAASV